MALISPGGPPRAFLNSLAPIPRILRQAYGPKEAGVKLACYGVVSGRDETDWRRIFEFAKAAGIETITSEPDPKHMDMLDKLCEEYAINVAIHNHPKASRYWNPDTVLGAVRGRSKRIGACADTGHWVRSGLDPLECLKKLEGRIVSLEPGPSVAAPKEPEEVATAPESRTPEVAAKTGERAAAAGVQTPCRLPNITGILDFQSSGRVLQMTVREADDHSHIRYRRHDTVWHAGPRAAGLREAVGLQMGNVG